MSGQKFNTSSGTKIVDAIADHLFLTVRDLSDEQLAATIQVSKKSNSTNCPWQRFDAVKSILPFALEEKRDRACRNNAAKR